MPTRVQAPFGQSHADTNTVIHVGCMDSTTIRFDSLLEQNIGLLEYMYGEMDLENTRLRIGHMTQKFRLQKFNMREER